MVHLKKEVVPVFRVCALPSTAGPTSTTEMVQRVYERMRPTHDRFVVETPEEFWFHCADNSDGALEAMIEAFFQGAVHTRILSIF